MEAQQTGGGGRVRRVGGDEDAGAAAALLDRFNREYETPTPGSEFLARRIEELDGDQFAVYLAREEDEDVGVGVIRFRPAIWSDGLEGYIAELYVIGDHRERGLGGELLEAMLARARELGCDWVELGTDENDSDAHRLYERFGFSNFVNRGAPADERERMLVYEREL